MATEATGSTASGATPASPTGNDEGGNPASVTPASPKSGRERIAERVSELRTKTAEPEAQPAEGENKTAEPAETQGDKSKDDKGKKDPESVPMKAFKERLGRETEKRRAVEGELATAKLQLQKQEAALRLVMEEMERLSAARRDGTALDERDEQIQAMRLSEDARKRSEEIQRAHEQAIVEAEQRAAVSVSAERLGEEMDTALADHDLVDRAELIAALRADAAAARKREEAGGDGSVRSVSAVAAELQANRLEKAKRRLVLERPATPSTVRPQGSANSASVRHSNDRQGIQKRIAELRARAAEA